ncbi:23S rRNA (uracil-5-)-methyltransferase RumA [Companilactobacillus sp. RD055328]|uniref:23S rRNA (uracil(1939)-C(5))-methyltransferase RlmD n=1 Tax=Companilactobacillus sp. RD055328 TaxID=2916634 RepID=UPI001FC80D24|nr:23S rRNA (uracil(1939)-C(5))-methyltransferase RlmD [Companilactobacillus sp. RD055328]GKQ43109.1 23S rRNA (uracil-5-)-methyltransferase RumA [Companilactobacillus sp. RD055328]
MEKEEIELKIGDRFPLTIKKIGINGEGVGYFKRKTTFVAGAITGEEIVCEVKDIHDKYIVGKLHKIRKKSPNRNDEFKELADKVGGLELAHIKYSEQLKVKKNILEQALERFTPAGWHRYIIKDTIGMQTPLHYRNKAQFQVRKINDKVIAGLYQHGTHDVVDLPEMPTQSSMTLVIINKLKSIIEDLDIPIYNPDEKSGIIKTLVVRESMSFKNAQLTIITNSQKLPRKRELIERINQEIPEIISISQNVNKGETTLVWGEDTTLLWGEKYLQETINGLTFNLSPRAFLQLNIEQTKKMYNIALDYLDADKNSVLYDAYAGVGTIGLSLAKNVKMVYGSEIIPEAIADAKINAEQNNITNADYRVDTAVHIYDDLIDEGVDINTLIVDPPRTGLEDDLLDAIVDMAPEKFVYISCNPSTLAKDLRELSKTYIVEDLQPIDMFPQTPHVETVVKLKRK